MFSGRSHSSHQFTHCCSVGFRSFTSISSNSSMEARSTSWTGHSPGAISLSLLSQIVFSALPTCKSKRGYESSRYRYDSLRSLFIEKPGSNFRAVNPWIEIPEGSPCLSMSELNWPSSLPNIWGATSSSRRSSGIWHPGFHGRFLFKYDRDQRQRK